MFVPTAQISGHVSEPQLVGKRDIQAFLHYLVEGEHIVRLAMGQKDTSVGQIVHDGTTAMP